MLQYLFYWINVIYIDLHLNNQGFQGLYGLKLLVFFLLDNLYQLCKLLFVGLFLIKLNIKIFYSETVIITHVSIGIESSLTNWKSN